MVYDNEMFGVGILFNLVFIFSGYFGGVEELWILVYV